jgi:hypothetical protein
MDINPRSNLKARTELLYFALTEPAGALLRFGVLIWKSTPNGLHDQLMYLSQLGNRDEGPLGWTMDRTHRVCINPLGGVSIALDLQILAQVLIADRTALGKQSLDLTQNERVALHCCRVMRLFVPYALPYPLCFDGQR